MPTLRPLPRTLLRDAAYVAIRDAIVREEMAPGAALNDEELAASLGVSRAPIRDSLARLVYEGLVETKPQSYTRVTPLDSHVVRDAAEVVGAMHEIVTRTALSRLSPEDVGEMRRANRSFAAAARAGDVDGALRDDDRFHDVLVRASEHWAARETIERYTPLIRRLERRLFSEAGARQSVRLHEALIGACTTRDLDAALDVTRRIWSTLGALAIETIMSDASPARGES